MAMFCARLLAVLLLGVAAGLALASAPAVGAQGVPACERCATDTECEEAWGTEDDGPVWRIVRR
jgi:hypothetical protein